MSIAAKALAFSTAPFIVREAAVMVKRFVGRLSCDRLTSTVRQDCSAKSIFTCSATRRLSDRRFRIDMICRSLGASTRRIFFGLNRSCVLAS